MQRIVFDLLSPCNSSDGRKDGFDIRYADRSIEAFARQLDGYCACDWCAFGMGWRASGKCGSSQCMHLSTPLFHTASD